MFNKGHRCRSQSGVAEEIVKNIARNNFIRNLISRLSFSASWVKKKNENGLYSSSSHIGTVEQYLCVYWNTTIDC